MSPPTAASSDRGLRWLVAFQGVWLALVFVLGAWWASVLMRQADEIVVLQRAAGMAAEAQVHWNKTQRMLFWESGTFVLLLVATSFALMTIYWRDLRRTLQIRTFFAAVTHELRTPLTSIRLQAESLAETFPVTPESEPLVRRLLEDTQRLEAEVERTLQLARLKGGGALFLQTLRLKPLLERHLEASSSDRAHVDLEAEDLLVEADASAISVILRNLIENSIKHSRKSPVKIQVSLHSTPQGAALQIQDDGAGFAGKPAKLGELFHRGEGSQGSGVGLHLVRELMRQMGGRAEFHAQGPGFGVTLRFKEAKAHGG